MKSKMLIVCCVVGIAFLATGAGAECIWPGEGVEAVAGKCATVTVKDGETVLRAAPTCPTTVWPAVYFTFPAERDLSKAGAVRVTLTNRTDRSLRVGVKVKGVTVQGRLPDGSFVIPPFAAEVKDLRLFAESWAFDKPHGLLGLKRNPGVGGMSSYSLEKVKAISVYLPAGTTDAEIGVRAVETVPGDGQGNRLTVLKADSFFPWVDEFGQANYAEWPDKVHSREEFLARAEAEERELAAHPKGIPDADRFGGWAAGPQLKATGFFRTEKVNGKWWFVDPDGRLFLSHGVNCGWELASTGVSGRENYFEKLPPKEGETKPFWTYHKKPIFRNFYGDPKNAPFWSFSFSAYNVWLKFGPDWRQKNVENTARRLQAWGLNTTTGASPELRKSPGHVPYVVGIGPKSRKIEGANGYWGKLLDPFAPEFEESCRREVKSRLPAGTNEWCLGWTSNNELSWGADGAALARGVLASPDDQPAKVALLKLLADRGIAPDRVTDADLRRLGEAVAEKYYSTVRAAIKAVAPNHLYLGDRNDKRNPEVFRAAARNADVVTVNVYEHRPSVTLPRDAADKPLMVTEFHFGCYDTGYFYASLIPVKDQQTRAACYRDYLRTVVDRPDYVGAHWFCWRDCPITGQLGEGANAQCGLVSTADVPYSELVSAIRDIAREMYPRRYSEGKPVAAAKPDGLTVEYRDEPVGIDAARPRLSWKLPGACAAQTAYEIDAGVWKSGKVASSQSVNVEWNGPALRSSQRVEWKVRVWDADGSVSGWSDPQTFVMGVLRPTDWRAKWIGPNAVTRPDEDMGGAKWITGTKDEKGVVVLRRRFTLGELKKGEFVEMVHTGLPQNDIFVNGKECNRHSGHLWRPEFLRYRDITPWLVKGENVVEVRLVKDTTKSVDDSTYAFLAKFTFPDGGRIVTDASWEGARELGGLRDIPLGRKLVLRRESRSPAFEKTFEIAKPVKSATLHVTGVGFYEASLNGVKVGDKVLDPAPSDFDDHVLYSTYAAEKGLRRGTNTLRVLVGHGWYDVRSVATWNFETAPWRDFPRMIAQLEIVYADGTEATVASDGSWRQVTSPVLYDCIREGEILDADGVRGMTCENLAAEEVPGPKGELVAENCPGAKVMRELAPETVRDFGNGTYVVKFPENFAGWVRLTLDGQKRGDVVVVRYDERVNTDLSPAAPSVRNGLNADRQAVDVRKAKEGDETRRIDCHFRYTASHRIEREGAEFQADRWICAGGVETYEPRFTYNGFQYVVLRGLRSAPKKVVGCVVHTAFRDVGTFSSSDATLDALVGMASRAYKSNFADGYPTDCPHREKNGWTGDASIASELAQYLFENTAAYEKWLRDLCDTQAPNGDICCIAPTSGWGFAWGNGPAWDSALPVIAWTLYVYRDDRRVLDAVYPALVRYLAYTATKADAQGLVKHGLGDWIPVVRKHMPSTELTSSCYYYQAQAIAAKIAAVKGLASEAAAFAEGAERTRRGINAKYYRGEGVYDNGGQTAQAFPIAFGVVDPSERDKVAAKLAESVEKTGRHVDMGLLGTKHVFRALSRIGRTDLAYAMLTNPTKPSMVEWVQKGGTTLWEDWGDGASRNHIMFGDFAGWAYQYLAGIGLPETEASCSAIPDVRARGFREVVFAPAVIDGLDRVSASVDTPYGVYASSWERRDGKVQYRFTVPAGGRATVRRPGKQDEQVGPGTHAFVDAVPRN